MEPRQGVESNEATVARESLLSLARAELFFMDLLALQDVLKPRRLITPEVESVVSRWVDANASGLATLRDHLHAWTAEGPSEILNMTCAVEATLQQLTDRLPVIREHPSELGSPLT